MRDDDTPAGRMPRDLDILKTINRVNEGNLGVLARVVGEGWVSVGDVIALADDARALRRAAS